MGHAPFANGQTEYSRCQSYALHLVGSAWCWTQLMRLSRALNEKQKVILQHDNAPPHVTKPVKIYLETLKWEVLPHAPYSPDVDWFVVHLKIRIVFSRSYPTIARKMEKGSGKNFGKIFGKNDGSEIVHLITIFINNNFFSCLRSSGKSEKIEYNRWIRNI